jgi:hypothetical protein
MSLIVAALSQAAIAQQPPPAPAPAAPAPAVPGQAGPPKPGGPALSFASDAGLIIFTVRAEGASDFEAYFARVKEALWKGANPQYEQMAKSWILFKVAEGPAAGQILYWALMNPVVKVVDYDPVKILADVFADEALALHPKLKDALVSVNRVNLSVANNLGAGCYLAGVLPCHKFYPAPPVLPAAPVRSSD